MIIEYKITSILTLLDEQTHQQENVAASRHTYHLGSKRAIPAPWYHGRISRADAEQSLSSTLHDCFLIRESEAEPDALSISLKHEGQPRHFLIRRPAGQYEVVGTGHCFPDLSSLVAHYSEHPLSVRGEKLTRTCHVTPDTFTLPLQGIYIVLVYRRGERDREGGREGGRRDFMLQ